MFGGRTAVPIAAVGTYDPFRHAGVAILAVRSIRAVLAVAKLLTGRNVRKHLVVVQSAISVQVRTDLIQQAAVGALGRRAGQRDLAGRPADAILAVRAVLAIDAILAIFAVAHKLQLGVFTGIDNAVIVDIESDGNFLAAGDTIDTGRLVFDGDESGFSVGAGIPFDGAHLAGTRDFRVLQCLVGIVIIASGEQSAAVGAIGVADRNGGNARNRIFTILADAVFRPAEIERFRDGGFDRIALAIDHQMVPTVRTILAILAIVADTVRRCASPVLHALGNTGSGGPRIEVLVFGLAVAGIVDIPAFVIDLDSRRLRDDLLNGLGFFFTAAVTGGQHASAEERQHKGQNQTELLHRVSLFCLPPLAKISNWRWLFSGRLTHQQKARY